MSQKGGLNTYGCFIRPNLEMPLIGCINWMSKSVQKPLLDREASPPYRAIQQSTVLALMPCYLVYSSSWEWYFNGIGNNSQKKRTTLYKNYRILSLLWGVVLPWRLVQWFHFSSIKAQPSSARHTAFEVQRAVLKGSPSDLAVWSRYKQDRQERHLNLILIILVYIGLWPQFVSYIW